MTDEILMRKEIAEWFYEHGMAFPGVDYLIAGLKYAHEQKSAGKTVSDSKELRDLIGLFNELRATMVVNYIKRDTDNIKIDEKMTTQRMYTEVIEQYHEQIKNLKETLRQGGELKEIKKSIVECCLPCSMIDGESRISTGLDGTKEKLSDCCGVLYADIDGKIKCNECGREFEVKPKG